MSLAFTTFKLLTPAQLLVLVLAHFLPAFFQHTGHAFSLLHGAECRSFRLKLQGRRRIKLIMVGPGPSGWTGGPAMR